MKALSVFCEPYFRGNPACGSNLHRQMEGCSIVTQASSDSDAGLGTFRDAYGEGASLAFGGFHRHGASVCFDYVLYYQESQASSAMA